MKSPDLPPDEAERIAALRGLNILDTPPEERFDRVTRLAAQLFGVPIAVISLVDAKRQWFKSRHGLDAIETPRDVSFCGHAILQDGVFHVPDALQDPAFADNPLVLGDPKIRFYAGTPLRTKSGAALGTLCLIDTKPRDFGESDRALLNELGRWAEQMLTQAERGPAPGTRRRWWIGILITAAAVGLFEFLSSQLFYIPNPALLLIAVVFAAYYGGLGAGMASAAIAWAYIAHFFSIPGQAFHYAGDNLIRVLIWAVTIPAIAIMTGLLQRRAARLFETDMANAMVTSHLMERVAANAALRKSHEQLRLVTDNAPHFIALYDAGLRCRYANQSYARWLGTDVQQMIGKTASEILGDKTIQQVYQPVLGRVFAGERIDLEREHRHADGRISHLAVSLIPHVDDGAHVAGFYAFISDITERKNAALEIARTKERLALALAGSNLSLWDFDCASGTVYLDPVWARMLGEEPGETNTTVEKLLAQTHPDDGERLLEVSLMAMKGETEGYAEEHRVRTHSGAWLWIASSGKVVQRGADGRALRVIGTNADISERKQADARIEILATRDPLTSLPNRRVLNDRIAHAMLAAERRDEAFFALLFIDLDRFKIINESLGHSVGDQLLKQVAERISATMRKGDTLARLGGDEFAVVLERLHKPDDAGPVAGKIVDALVAPFDVDGHALNVSCSIGISVFPSDAGDAANLLRNSDLAMYAAKESGRNTYRYFSPEMNQRAVEKLALERALRAALQAGQFELYYQPKFSLEGDRLAGMEALLRWRHPEQGLISPARFIPIAEDARLIGPLGNWVLRRACTQVMEWAQRGHALVPVAVNLSVGQFDASLVDSIREALRASGMEARNLEVEITESVLVRDVDEHIDILRQLSDLGVRIAIDDFGTGYSSLS